MTRDRTRRGVLRLGGTVLAAGVTVGFAGCSGDGGDGDGNGNGNGSGTDTLDVVPAGATSTTYADVAGLLEDGTVEGVLNELLSVAEENGEEEAPANKQEMLDQFQDETGLDPQQMEEMVGFGKPPETGDGETVAPGAAEAAAQYSGTWFTAGWSEDDLVAAVQEGSDEITLESDTYNGYTIYEPSSTGGETPSEGGMEAPTAWLGVIGDGEYVTGTEEAVSDALDVDAGDMDSVGNDLRDAYSGVRGGLVKTATTVPENLPEDSLPDGTVGEEDVEIDPARLQELQGGALVLYTDDDEMGLSASMTAETEEAAQHVVDIIDALIISMEKALEETGQTATPPEDLVAALEDISVDRNGTSVSVSYANDLESLSGIIELIAEVFFMAGENQTPTPGDSTYGLSLPV